MCWRTTLRLYRSVSTKCRLVVVSCSLALRCRITSSSVSRALLSVDRKLSGTLSLFCTVFALWWLLLEAVNKPTSFPGRVRGNRSWLVLPVWHYSVLYIVMYFVWRHSVVVEKLISASEPLLPCAKLVVSCVTTLSVKHLLSANWANSAFPPFGVGKWVATHAIRWLGCDFKLQNTW